MGKFQTMLMSATSATVLLAFAHRADATATLIASIYGFYDAESGIGNLPSGVTSGLAQVNSQSVYDTPSLFFVNPTAYTIDNASITLSVTPAMNNGGITYNNNVSETFDLGNLAPGAVTQLAWNGQGPSSYTQNNNIFSAGVSLMASDYDDIYGSNYGAITSPASPVGNHATDCTLTYSGGPDPQWQNFCAPTGNFHVTFSGTLNGSGPFNTASVGASFGEISVGGSYTGWEGLDPNGWSENASYDVHSGTVSGVLANIYLGNPSTVPSSPSSTPEPGTLSLFAAGLGAVGLLRRRRKRG